MTFTADTLIRALESTGQRPALTWYEDAGRVELSGHVLANWIIKSTNYLRDELMLDAGAVVRLEMAPHWKRLVLACAAWAAGAVVEIHSAESDSPTDRDPSSNLAPSSDLVSSSNLDSLTDVVVTDDPAAASEADEVLAVDPVSLAMRFSVELPPLVRDWVVDVRGSSDRPTAPLDAWSGPLPAEGWEATGLLAASANSASSPGVSGTTSAPFMLNDDGLGQVSEVLAALLAGRVVVGPA